MSTGRRAVVAVVIGFAIPLIGWALPGERGPDTLLGVLAEGVVLAVLAFGMQTVRQGMRSKAVDAGRDLRARHDRRERAAGTD